jgi:hypothetical protein
VSLSAGTTNPVSVLLTAANTPLNTILTLKLIPVAGNPSTFPVTALSGTPSQSTATSNVTFPSGQVSVLNAYASLTLTAGLFPMIDGEEVDRVLLAAVMGGPSTTTLVTRSGREVPMSALSETMQVQVAMAFEAMQQQGSTVMGREHIN